MEVKQNKSKTRKNLYDILKTFSINIDHKISGIKRNFIHIKGIAVLSSIVFPLNNLSPYILAEFFDTDKVFIDLDINMIPSYIKQNLDNFQD